MLGCDLLYLLYSVRARTRFGGDWGGAVVVLHARKRIHFSFHRNGAAAAAFDKGVLERTVPSAR
jgi:hypothetical protein